MDFSQTSIIPKLQERYEYSVFLNDSDTNNLIAIVSFILISIFILTILLLIMLYCYSKQRNSYKTAPTDLATFTYSSSLSTSSHSSLITNTDSLSTTSQSTSTNSSITIAKTPLKEISISLPIAKPTFNESKPQLSIDSKMKTKTLFESKSLYNKRRGSNNSLTLTINPIKKKLTLSSPSKECSTLDYLSKASRLLTIPDLIEISKDGTNLYNEFYLIPFNHAELHVQGSSIKNRYKTIVPNETTRVRLPIRNNDPLSSYINANYITGYKDEPKAYIASQGPMSNTINDFWFTIWTEQVTCIVMITKLFERNKNKCELYIPEQINETKIYDNIKVSVNQVKQFQDYEIRQISVTCNNETRIVYHYWYTAWPDHNLPENPNALIQLIKQVENLKKFDDMKKGRVLVHCSAGVGRTGCFLAIAIGIKQIDNEALIDIVKIVCRLRKERGGMIQTLEQYEFIYQVLAYYCVYYKNFPILPTSIQCSPILSSPSSLCLKSPTETTSFQFTTPTN
ncbi:unnamed protein product [Brachionus calyciflorus]|uniref:protein-tyrosine-phosphatase n=1 Tax=Brachionus calyciflorus TaxID=104777 RepID=A0A813XRJ4_9BILA|nr:unnamed protein product [Brachionus calyciflorus]